MEDEDGMINLNDLHKFSGLGKNRAPNRWVRSLSDKASAKIGTRHGGSGSGTWAPRREALKYAGWLCEEFEDAVYEAFENLMDNKVSDAAAAVHKVYRDAARDFATGTTGRDSNRIDAHPDWM